AVRLVEEGGLSIGQVARDLGINDSVLRRWRDRILSEGAGSSPTDLFPGNGKLTTQGEEIRRLRRELEAVRQERDLLKKAAAYFAKASRGGTQLSWPTRTRWRPPPCALRPRSRAPRSTLGCVGSQASGQERISDSSSTFAAFITGATKPTAVRGCMRNCGPGRSPAARAGWSAS